MCWTLQTCTGSKDGAGHVTGEVPSHTRAFAALGVQRMPEHTHSEKWALSPPVGQFQHARSGHLGAYRLICGTVGAAPL